MENSTMQPYTRDKAPSLVSMDHLIDVQSSHLLQPNGKVKGTGRCIELVSRQKATQCINMDVRGTKPL